MTQNKFPEEKPNKKVLQRRQTMALLIAASIPIFEKKGFDNALLNDITQTANLGAGTLNKCFGSKENFGTYVAMTLFKHITVPLKHELSFSADPILFMLTMIDTFYLFMVEKWGYKTFFIDSLKHDFIQNHLLRKPTPFIIELIRHYKPDARPDRISLYSELMPYMLGRIIILKKQEGLLTSIADDEIPVLMCHEALRHFVSDDDIRRKAPEALRIAHELCDKLEHWPSMETIMETILDLS